MSPSHIFEIIAAEPDSTCVWVGRKNGLVEKFVSAGDEGATGRYSFRWWVSGQSVRTFAIYEQDQPEELTSRDFHRRPAYRN